MTSLYQLSAQYQVLLNKDQLTGEELQELESLHDSIEDKAINYAYHIKNLEAEIAMIKSAMDDMKARLDRLNKSKEYWSGILSEYLEKCQVNEITKSPYFKIKLKYGRGRVEVLDESLIPEFFIKRKEIVTIDKIALNANLQEGLSIPGATLVIDRSVEIK